MSENAYRILEIQEMIKNHQSAVKLRSQKLTKKLAEHNTSDEDLSKVASIDFIGKSDFVEELKK